MVLIWTFNFLIAKVALRHWRPGALASFRVITAAIFMAAVFAVWMRGSGAKSAAKQEMSGRDLAWLGLLGVLGVAGNQMLFTIGLSYTTAGHSALIIGAGPITILLLSRIMKLELLTVNKLAGMLLCFTGVGVLALEKGIDLHSSTLKGDVITWTGSLSFCLYTVLGKRFAAKFDTMVMNVWTYAAGALVALPLAAMEARQQDWQAMTWQGWSGMLYMAVFASVTAYLIFYWALRHMAASRLAVFTYLQPVLVTGLGLSLLGERITPNLVWGGALVLAGVFLAERQRRAARRSPQSITTS
jgi:drug/metabolite transporter (DMT)-like permease